MQAVHENMVSILKKSGEDIFAQMTPEKADLNHMAMGIAGEAGELVDAIKRFTIYNKSLDRENVIEELGDIEFFLEGLRQRLRISRNETLAHNIEKLGKRYAGLIYSDQAAHARVDKA